jgi:uncharacterized protein (TIGR02231 family)
MKKTPTIFLLLGFFLSAISSCAFASDIEAESRITQVAVYPDSALISRMTTLKLEPGEHKVTFSNIIPEVDENSLRVSGEGTAQVKLFGAQVKREFLKETPSENIKQLQEEIQKLEDSIRKLEDYKKILSDEKQYLDSIRLFSKDQIPKDMVTKMPQTSELEGILKFLDIKLKENYSLLIDTELQIREIQKKVDALRRELDQVSGTANKLKRSIVVELEVTKAGSLNLIIAYLVRGASWYPIYDARANFEKSEVELVSYAIVKQTTGEDWSDVTISLSTAKPTISGRMPYVAPWFLRPYQPPRVTEARRAYGLARSRTTGDEIGEQFEAFNAVPAKSIEPLQKMEVEYAQPEEKGIAVVYKLSRKETVKSDGSEHKLSMSSQTLKADFEYTTYPRLSTFAYLGSRVTNVRDLQLLAGRLNVFLEGDFVGQSSIDNIGPGEEFDLYLGVDENVKVKREQIEKKVDDVLIANIPAPNRRTTFKYKTTIENYKNKRVRVIFFEAMPVSQDERIKVRIDKASLEPKEKDWKDRKGIWRWELELGSKEKKEIFYTFSIEHPRDMEVGGL